jgi:hypothetical protein
VLRCSASRLAWFTWSCRPLMEVVMPVWAVRRSSSLPRTCRAPGGGGGVGVGGRVQGGGRRGTGGL